MNKSRLLFSVPAFAVIVFASAVGYLSQSVVVGTGTIGASRHSPSSSRRVGHAKGAPASVSATCTNFCENIPVDGIPDIRLVPDRTLLSISYCLHVMRLYGAQARIYLEDSRDDSPALDILTRDEVGREFLGKSAFVRTREGLRFPIERRGQPFGEAHRDQCLASLAECGIPLSQSMVLEGRTYSLKDVLYDSVANFNLQQTELAWTAQAYAYYLPPSRSWANRYGTQFSFDDVANELLSRPLGDASCGGTHVLMALTTLSRVDAADHRLLSEQTRKKLTQFIMRAAQVAIDRQRTDGSWNEDWHLGFGRKSLSARTTNGAHGQLLATGHIAEWMMYLPDSKLGVGQSLHSAAPWLVAKLQATKREEAMDNVCPFTHAFAVVQTGRRSMRQASDFASK